MTTMETGVSVFVRGFRVSSVIVAGGTTLLFTTRDFPDRQSALAYRKQPGQREETTYMR